jgi:peptide/nickel transport system permease protein
MDEGASAAGGLVGNLANELSEEHVWSRNVIAQRFLSDPVACGCVVIIAAYVFCAFAAPLISPYGPNAASPLLRLKGIGTPGHILGLDTQGRDVLARLIWGTKMSLITGVVPVVIGGAVAIPLGMIAARYHFLGDIIMRLMDVFFAFPMVLLAILLTTFTGPGLTNLIFALTIILVPYNTRIVFVETGAQLKREYVEAARACGSSDLTILFGEVWPHVVSATVVYSMTVIGPLIIIASGLSFLGLGIQPPTPEWGLMVSEGKSVLYKAPHLSTLPGLMIVVLTIAINLAGDALSDALDPRRRLTR